MEGEIIKHDTLRHNYCLIKSSPLRETPLLYRWIVKHLQCILQSSFWSSQLNRVKIYRNNLVLKYICNEITRIFNTLYELEFHLEIMCAKLITTNLHLGLLLGFQHSKIFNYFYSFIDYMAICRIYLKTLNLSCLVWVLYKSVDNIIIMMCHKIYRTYPVILQLVSPQS